MNLSIRPFSADDVSTLVSFQTQMAFETEALVLDPAILSKGITAMADDPSKGLYYLIEVDQRVVGCFMITTEWSDWRNGTTYWLQSLFIEKEHRGKGLFRKVFDFLKNKIQEDEHAVGLRLYVDRQNMHAQKAYASVGMNGDHYTVFEWMK